MFVVNWVQSYLLGLYFLNLFNLRLPVKFTDELI